MDQLWVEHVKIKDLNDDLVQHYGIDRVLDGDKSIEADDLQHIDHPNNLR
jgi:hypothetical protein